LFAEEPIRRNVLYFRILCLGTFCTSSIEQDVAIARADYHQRGAMKTDKAIWYVSFAMRNPDAGHHRFARQTRTFTTEQDAKAFARTLLVQTQDISAGTINPHIPRRVIAPAAITAWAGDS
jgi:hypothetical protein